MLEQCSNFVRDLSAILSYILHQERRIIIFFAKQEQNKRITVPFPEMKAA